MEIALAVIFALIGLAVGSFLNVVADRLPNGQSIVSPPSHCPGCGRKIGASDLIPVVSYLVLKGRCRECGASIPKRVPIIEAATGAIFVLLYLRFGLTWRLPVNIYYFCTLFLLLIMDLEHKMIYAVIIYPAIIISLIISAFTPEIGIVSALIGGGTGLFILAFILIAASAILKRQAMGWGDVQIAVFMGFCTGFPLFIIAFYLAILPGGIVSLFLLLTRKKKGTDPIPFGVFLSIGTMITLLWGGDILNWYLNFYGF